MKIKISWNISYEDLQLVCRDLIRAGYTAHTPYPWDVSVGMYPIIETNADFGLDRDKLEKVLRRYRPKGKRLYFEHLNKWELVKVAKR